MIEKSDFLCKQFLLSLPFFASFSSDSFVMMKEIFLSFDETRFGNIGHRKGELFYFLCRHFSFIEPEEILWVHLVDRFNLSGHGEPKQKYDSINLLRC